jgi:FtsZ-binding cell division protein ZapB
VEHLDNLKLYKPQLAALLEDSWVDSMQILKAVIAKLSKRNEKALEDKERKINELLRMNRELEKEQQKWSEKVDKLEHLREL